MKLDEVNMSTLLLTVATGVLVVWNTWVLLKLRRSPVATSVHKRHAWGHQFIGLMVLAAILLEAPFGETVRNLVASFLGIAGIALLFSTDG